MQVILRQAKAEDASSMLELYDRFTRQFIGSASRTIKSFRSMVRKKDNINFVALNGQNQIIGYVHAHLEKQFNRGDFGEIVIDPKHDVESVATQLVEKVNVVFMEKKVSSITAGSLRNPIYEKVFPKLGFIESESMGVFMYGILNVPKFLNEITPVFVNRLKQLEDWSGFVQVDCEGHSLFLQKTKEKVESIVWTNKPVNLKISLSQQLLTQLIFGLVDPVDSHRSSQLGLETSEGSEKANHLLKTLFPKMRFLIMDSW